MSINNNRWNRLRYTLYTPAYDRLGGIFQESRKRSVEFLEIREEDRILLIGAGTGLDLEFLPEKNELVATDLTPAMLDRMVLRNKELRRNLECIVMDGQQLAFPDQCFDKVILHLILAVIPDPVKCLMEAERVLKPGGKIAVFDKFIPKGHTPSLGRKLLNLFTNLLFSDITRDIEKIASSTRLNILQDLPADLNGNFRIITLQKPAL